MKRTLCVVFSLLIFLGLFCGCEKQENRAEIDGIVWGYTLSGGKAVIYPGFDKAGEDVRKYVSSLSGNIEIPSKIDGKDVTEIAEDAFIDCKNIETVTIPEGVIKIGSNAFLMCSGLKEINLPHSLKYVGQNAFSKTGIESIKLYENFRSFSEDTCEPFFGCTALKDIVVSSDNDIYKSENGVLFTNNMKTLVAYPAAKQTDKYTVPDTVEKINKGAFSGCSELSTLEFPASVDSVLCDFYGCDKLSTIYVKESKLKKYSDNKNFKNIELITY